jgi:hypothetical protein
VVELVVEKLVVAGTVDRERGREKLQKRGQRGWFLADFGPIISSLMP